MWPVLLNSRWAMCKSFQSLFVHAVFGVHTDHRFDLLPTWSFGSARIQRETSACACPEVYRESWLLAHSHRHYVQSWYSDSLWSNTLPRSLTFCPQAHHLRTCSLSLNPHPSAIAGFWQWPAYPSCPHGPGRAVTVPCLTSQGSLVLWMVISWLMDQRKANWTLDLAQPRTFISVFLICWAPTVSQELCRCCGDKRKTQFLNPYSFDWWEWNMC